MCDRGSSWTVDRLEKKIADLTNDNFIKNCLQIVKSNMFNFPMINFKMKINFTMKLQIQ